MDSAAGADEQVLQDSVKNRDIPLCSICLIGFIVIAHTMVLMGNMSTASAFGGIGTSTAGWSDVGIALADSIDGELQDVLKEVTSDLTLVIGKIQEVQNMLDFAVGFQSKSIDAVVSHNATKALVLLQAHGVIDASHLSNGLSGMVAKSMTTSLEKLTGMIQAAIKALLKMLKPSLVQVGKFIIKFGEKAQTIIETFSVTLDRVQKIFDQIMSQTASAGGSTAQLEHETWHIFDTTDTGAISPTDLKNVAHIYNVPALQGNKSDHLVAAYDKDGSGDLDKGEFSKMVHDKDVPNLMSVVLRSFAKSLAQVAGQVGHSKFRGEIASDVADYLELMTAKNLTKVTWICDALGNGSVPLEFVADVFASIALKVDDPNSHKSVPTGPTVLVTMMKLHPKETAKAIDKISNATYWTSQGFMPSDHAAVVKRVTAWSTKHHVRTVSGLSISQTVGLELASRLIEKQSSNEAHVDADGSVNVDSTTMRMERKLLNTMEELAYRVTEENMRLHLNEIDEEHRTQNHMLLGSETAQYLTLHLMGGERACKKKGHPNSPAAQALKTQIPAAPETLQFAKWLSWNATATAMRFQKMSFDHQKTSSNAIDSFATQIQGMVKKVQGFIKMMMQYSTPDGIDSLENTLLNYAEKQLSDMLAISTQRVKHVLKTPSPAPADVDFNAKMSGALESPLGQGLAPNVATELAKALNEEIAGASDSGLGQEIAKLFEQLSEASLSSVASSIGEAAQDSFVHISPTDSFSTLHETGMGNVDQVLMAELGQDVYSSLNKARSPSHEGILLQTDNQDFAEVSGLMEDALGLLKSLTHVLPQATKALVFARKEVSMLGKTLDTIFKTFGKSGPSVLDEVESAYGTVWELYYFIMLPLPLALLFYAFWAGGFFGGPGQAPGEEEAAPAGCWQKTQKCFNDCCLCCCMGPHGKCPMMCFWSMCLFLQVIVLILFLLSFVLTILGAVQMFLASGCAQIYLLGDGSICGGVLGALRDFLDTFLHKVVKSDDFSGHCQDANLLTCKMISSDCTKSAIMTILGSFLAAAMTFQMLIESASLHTRALSRLEIQNQWSEKAGKAA